MTSRSGLAEDESNHLHTLYEGGVQRTQSYVETDPNKLALEIITVDRDEWKRRALAAEQKHERLSEIAAPLMGCYCLEEDANALMRVLRPGWKVVPA